MDKLKQTKTAFYFGGILYGCFMVFNQILYVGMIASDSMSPTLLRGNVIIALRGKSVDYGDIVVFEEEGRYKVKRLVGKSGDRLCYREQRLYRNGQMLSEDYILNTTFEMDRSFYVPKDCLMLLGDDRSKSIDTRKTGHYTPCEALVGTVIAII